MNHTKSFSQEKIFLNYLFSLFKLSFVEIFLVCKSGIELHDKKKKKTGNEVGRI